MFRSKSHFGETFFKSIVESSPFSILLFQNEFIIFTNKHAAQLFGYKKNELEGLKFEKLIPEKFKPNYSRFMTEFLKNPVSRSLNEKNELFGLRKDGVEFPIEVGLNPTIIEGEAYILAAVIDLTARKKNENRIRMIMEANPNSLIIVNKSGEIILSNTNTEKLFGYSKEELTNQKVEILLPEKQREHHTQLRNAYLANPETRLMGRGRDLTGRRKDGKEIPVEIGLNPFAQDGEEFILASIIDITERKTVEKEMENAKNLAIEASRIKSEFLANMSHEIRTPMNAVLGMTGLLLETSLDEEQKMFATTVLNAGEGLLQIINDILDYSRIEAGRFSLEFIDFNLKTVIRNAIDLVKVSAKAKGLYINFTSQPEVPRYINADPGRLRQVLLNLLSNAVKFTESGGIEVSVEKLESGDPNTILIKICVKDTGIGISPEEQRKLFQPFVQLDSGSSRKFGGTGLGLVISKKIADALNGILTVESTPGLGSSFCLTVPVRIAEGQQNRPKHDLNFESLKVLFISEKKFDSKELESLLEKWHVNYVFNSNLSAIYDKSIYDIIIFYSQTLIDPLLQAFQGQIQSLDLSNTKLIIIGPIGINLLPEIRQNNRVTIFFSPLDPSMLLDKIQEVKVLRSRGGFGVTSPPNQKDKKFKILLVEDNVANQKVTSYQLRKLGYQLDSVAGGREAIEAFKNFSYDLVLMDCFMPEMDGYQTTRQIRKIENDLKKNRTPIIAMTAANVLEGEHNKCLEAGMDDSLSKPVYIDELSHALSKFEKANSREDTSK